MPGEEIELIEILRIVWRRRKLIIAGTILSTLIVAVIVFLLPEVYRVSVIFEPGKRPITDQNGQILEEKVVESPEAIKEAILGGAYDDGIRKELHLSPDDFPRSFNVSVPLNTDLILVSVEGRDPALLVKILKEMARQVGSEVHEKLELEKNQIENEIKLARIDHQAKVGRVLLVESQMKNTQEKLRSLQDEKKKALSAKPTDAMSILLYSNEIQDNQVYLNNLQEKEKTLETEAKISEAKIQNLEKKLGRIRATKILKAPSLPEKPIKPKKGLILAVGFSLGLGFFLLLSFFLEYVRFHREGS